MFNPAEKRQIMMLQLRGGATHVVEVGTYFCHQPQLAPSSFYPTAEAGKITSTKTKPKTTYTDFFTNPVSFLTR